MVDPVVGTGDILPDTTPFRHLITRGLVDFRISQHVAGLAGVFPKVLVPVS